MTISCENLYYRIMQLINKIKINYTYKDKIK